MQHEEVLAKVSIDVIRDDSEVLDRGWGATLELKQRTSLLLEPRKCRSFAPISHRRGQIIITGALPAYRFSSSSKAHKRNYLNAAQPPKSHSLTRIQAKHTISDKTI